MFASVTVIVSLLVLCMVGVSTCDGIVCMLFMLVLLFVVLILLLLLCWCWCYG